MHWTTITGRLNMVRVISGILILIRFNLGFLILRHGGWRAGVGLIFTVPPPALIFFFKNLKFLYVLPISCYRRFYAYSAKEFI
jgi:hypothetical protein